MTTAKNKVFIGLKHENCYLVGRKNRWGLHKVGRVWIPLSTIHFSLKNIKRTSKNLRNIRCCRFAIPESRISQENDMSEL